MTTLIIIIFGLIWGTVCYKMAEHRGRSPLLGFILGFLFGLFAVIGYALAGETEEEKRKRIKEAVED